jgi:hypothetical protein
LTGADTSAPIDAVTDSNFGDLASACSVPQMSEAPSSPGFASLSQLPQGLRERLEARVERLGYLGAFYSHAASQPEALAHFIDWSETLKGAIPFRMAATVALTIASQTDNRYERFQHERLALARGMTREEIEAIESGHLARAPSLTEAEGAAAALSRCLVSDFGRGCGPPLIRLTRCTDEQTAVACLMLAARHIAHATMANAWALEPPVTSPFESDSQSV